MNLLVQIGAVLTAAVLFLVLLEGWGYLTLKVVRMFVSRLDGRDTSSSFMIVRIFIGCLSYVLVFLALGWMGLMSKSLVLTVSAVPPILALFLDKRWRILAPLKLSIAFRENFSIIIGTLIFLIFTFILWFRPVTNFDGTWYHLTVPKLFLQNHSIGDQGPLMRYSLQPSLDYFLNLWPLSLPVSTAVASILVNAIQALLLGLALAFSAQMGKKLFAWQRSYVLLAPFLIGFTYEAIRILGGGGNDVLGVAFGIVTALYCLYVANKKKVAYFEFICAVLLVVALATIKIFFSIFAALLACYLLFNTWNKLNSTSSKKKLTILGIILFTIFIVTYLPWIIRSYLATGLLLDPIGKPGLLESTYLNEGGGTAIKHWTSFIYERFYSTLLPTLFFTYSPLFIIGILSIANKMVRRRAANLWLIALVGYFVTFITSVAVHWRYFLPPVTILIFLGIAALYESLNKFNAFGKTLALGSLSLLILLSSVRVLFLAPDYSGYPSINHIIYVYNYRGVEDYLNRKITDAYDYVQTTGPADLKLNEKIFIGNTYLPFPDDLHDLHNLAYVKNPILEPTINASEFSKITDSKSFKKVLQKNQVRYVITRKQLDDVCKTMRITDYRACASNSLFTHVYHDSRSGVNWYKLQ